MFEHFSYFIVYSRRYANYLFRCHVTLAFLLLLVIAGGVGVSKAEGIKLGEGIYFACVTGLTIGYGDITPHTTIGRILSVLIALVGVVFVGLSVAIASRALADTVKQHHGRA